MNINYTSNWVILFFKKTYFYKLSFCPFLGSRWHSGFKRTNCQQQRGNNQYSGPRVGSGQNRGGTTGIMTGYVLLVISILMEFSWMSDILVWRICLMKNLFAIAHKEFKG